MIVSHVFRLYSGKSAALAGRDGVGRVDAGNCWYFARCNRPESEHITRAEYRARRGGG